MTSITRRVRVYADRAVQVNRPTLQETERAQIVARLVEAATAEGSDEFAPELQALHIDFPIAPREEIIGKRK
jgi:hypothetical protein